MSRPPRVLSIAGTDPTGGAGIQADLKSIAARGGYGMAVVTALVAQNTHGVRSVHVPPVSFLEEQLVAVSDDVTIDAVKIGMLGEVSVIETVAGWLDRVRPPVVVLDPVMIATSGDRLLSRSAEVALSDLVAAADLVTPNLPELGALLGEPEAEDWPSALEQGLRLARRRDVVVLVKGGHLGGRSCPDALVDPHAPTPVVEVPGDRVDSANTHGTGCSMSAAMATAYARSGDWHAALVETKVWLTDALRTAEQLEVGSGNGPINHFHQLWRAAGREETGDEPRRGTR